MPFFYKVSDFLDNLDNVEIADRWLSDVEFTIVNIMGICGTVFEQFQPEIAIILLRSDSINPHNLEFEYFTDNSISSASILDQSLWFTEQHVYNNSFRLNAEASTRLREFLTNLQQLYPNNYNNIFMHITCSGNQDSIVENGITAERFILPENRIGDRVNAYETKYLKYKTKYLELKKQIGLLRK